MAASYSARTWTLSRSSNSDQLVFRRVWTQPAAPRSMRSSNPARTLITAMCLNFSATQPSTPAITSKTLLRRKPLSSRTSLARTIGGPIIRIQALLVWRLSGHDYPEAAYLGLIRSDRRRTNRRFFRARRADHLRPRNVRSGNSNSCTIPWEYRSALTDIPPLTQNIHESLPASEPARKAKKQLHNLTDRTGPH